MYIFSKINISLLWFNEFIKIIYSYGSVITLIGSEFKQFAAQ